MRRHDVAGEHRRIAGRGSGPTACSSTARTDGSAEVEATASRQPGVARLADDPATPGRPGSAPGGDHLGVDLGLAPVPPAEQRPLARRRPSGRPGGRHELRREQAGHPLLAAADLQLLARTPPRYQCTGRPNSANVWLNAGRCPYRSVSASTPSQSKISAGSPGLARAAERAACVRRPSPSRPRALSRNSDGGSHLSGCLGASQELQVGLHERDLERRGDVDLRAAAGDQVARTASSVIPVPPCSAIGMPVASTMSVTRWVQDRARSM